ncbi:hypothetical protein K438DRAFT_1963648 [Mycena galopus ATCC 62051]|nr:hypothetical protein K438DRAFT_1963648 [Mycena galopus ATCC 62051]
MELYSYGASWLPHHWYQSLEGDALALHGYASPSPDYSVLAPPQTRPLEAPGILQPLNLITATFLIALAAFSLRILANQKIPKCIQRQLSLLASLKVLLGVVYLTGAVTMLVEVQKNQPQLKEVTSLSTGVATAIMFIVASISEHYHSVSPSTLTSLYAVIADAAVTVSLFFLIFLESKSKRGLLIPTDPPPAYESTISFLVKPFFPHIIPILYTGSRRRITLPELRDIPLHLRADPATEKLLAALAVEEKTSSWYLARSTFRAFSGYFLSPIFPRLIVLIATFSQVTLVEQMILYVSDKSIPKERGTWLVAAYIVVYVSLAIANYVYTEKVNAFIVLYRSALTGSLYAKTLRLTSMAARELGQGAATTYMSVDVEKVTSGFETLQELWAAVVIIMVACTMLWYKAGYVMFAPLLFVVTLISTTSSISRFVGAAQKAWLKAIDVRIKLLTSVLGQLLPIKLGAYEGPLSEKINALRKVETQALGKFMYYIGIAATFSNIGGSASFLVTLAAYTIMLAHGWGDLAPLDVSRIFALFTIVNLLNGPLNSIGQTLPSLSPESKETAVDADLVDVSVDGVKKSSVEVSLNGCTFAWDDKTHVLRDITLDLVPRELHMIVGSVASSPHVDIGRDNLVEGTAKVKAHKIALANQTAFIYPGTLRANILLDSAYDEVFYDEVIHACGLRRDIEALPRRDMTKLGDKGATLSGNCPRRYARADLILLDDVFSALDGETEAHVFASLFGPDGMLKGKTTVLVTHGVHHLPSADKVVIMDAGTITHFGTFEEVRDAGATFALASTAGDVDSETGRLAVKEGATEATVFDEEADEELSWANEQASRLGAYAFYMKCTGVVRACGLFALIVLWSVTGILATAYLSMLASSSGHLGLWVTGYGALIATALLCMAATLLYFGYILSGFTAPHIHGAELEGVMGSPISWITKNPVGKILNRFSQDIQVADQEFPFAFMNWNILAMAGSFVFITMATPLLAFALPFLAIFGAWFLQFYLATSKQFRRLELASKSPLYTLFGATVSGLITVRAYRAEAFFRSQNAAFINESQGALHHRVAGQLFLRVFLLWFQTILACGVAMLTILLRDTTSPAFLGIALSRLVSLGMSLTHLLTSYASVENGSIAIDRIEEFAKLPSEEALNTSDELPITINDGWAWPSAGSLTFSDFSMKYRDDLPLALRKLSFDLQGGLKIGICGRTGSGKSSTVLALFRGIDQHLVTGNIAIDGVDISTVPLKHLRDSMSIVTQDPFLWHGSIRENLDVTNACTDSEIWETLKLVEMHDAVSALDDKLDHLVVDEESFSKGQRQLLCLARALLRKKQIIVLDESTSSMDHITDEKIRHVVDTQMKGLTVIAIAHRISSIVNYDKVFALSAVQSGLLMLSTQILVLDSGSVAEFDEPKVLLSNPESRFARLAATQGIYHPDLVPKGTAVKDLGDGTVIVTEDLIDV